MNWVNKMNDFYEAVRDRLIRYARVGTQSAHNSGKTPSTQSQYRLAYMLRDELNKIGAAEVCLDEACCLVYAKIPSTRADGGGQPVGFVVHMDTSPDVPGEEVRPWVLEHYDGGSICLNEALGITMSPEDFPELRRYPGQDLILTDGTSLLGGDDKAAIASLMTAAEYLLAHPEIEHGPVSLAFTPDEEVGGLAKDLDFERFGAPLAYTVDGDHLGYYSDETFNATEAQLHIKGKNVHPGTAKGIMVNALEIGCEFIRMLPPRERPEYTEGREGFFHPSSFSGRVEEAELSCLIRDHDDEAFEARVRLVQDAVAALNARYGDDCIRLSFANGYRSMRRAVEPYPFLTEELVAAMREEGVEPVHLAFRGGTDGSALSQRGLPCPNLSAGYENGHSRFEFVPVQSMQRNTKILLNLILRLGKRG